MFCRVPALVLCGLLSLLLCSSGCFLFSEADQSDGAGEGQALDDDPAQQHNVAGDNPEAIQDILSRLEQASINSTHWRVVDVS